ncbi:MAG: hypothetical protein M5U28_13310 [Sandaracinaceae bacterium]|nr:hypothetical protein [Sandaracinaceae bacterium]
MDLLGRRVARRPDQGAGLREALVPLALLQLGDPEVEELHALEAAGQRHEEDVGRLEVAVDDARLVRGRERRQELHGDGRGARRREAAALQHREERLALEQLHDQEGRLARRLHEVGHLHDVRVHEPAGRLGLAAEALEVELLAAQLVREHLDGHAAADVLLHRLVDRAHAALAEGADHAEASVERTADQRGRGVHAEEHRTLAREEERRNLCAAGA